MAAGGIVGSVEHNGAGGLVGCADSVPVHGRRRVAGVILVGDDMLGQDASQRVGQGDFFDADGPDIEGQQFFDGLGIGQETHFTPPASSPLPLIAVERSSA